MYLLLDATGAIATYPYTITDLIHSRRDISFGLNISAEELAGFNVYAVTEVPAPTYDPITQSLTELPPAQVNGIWTQQWQINALPQAQIDQNKADQAAKAPAKAKEDRAAEVAALTVTTTAGNVFDGNEDAQSRMARAILSMTDTDTTTWILANNTVLAVTKAELLEALKLTGEAQTKVWVAPYIAN